VPDEARRSHLADALRDFGVPLRQFGLARRMLADVPTSATGCAVVSPPVPDGIALDVITTLAACAPALVPVVVTELPTVADAVTFMRQGAADVLEWPVSRHAFRAAVGHALESSGSRTTKAAAVARLSSLSHRHRDVIQLLLTGLSNRLVARRLGLGLRTVERLRAQSLLILGARTLAEAAERIRPAGSDTSAPARLLTPRS
jgi:FixJ family two-component response regulator